MHKPLTLFAAKQFPSPNGRLAAAAATALAAGLALAWLPLPMAVALVLGTAVLLLALTAPLAVLVLALLAGPLGAREALVWGPSPLDSGQLLLLLALAGWIGRSLRDRRLVLRWSAPALPLLLFVLVGLVSLWPARAALQPGLIEVVKWVEIGAIALMVIDLSGSGRPKAAAGGLAPADSRRQAGGLVPGTAVPWVVVLLGGLLLAGVCQSLLGIWQFGLAGDGPVHFQVLGRYYRAFGTFMQPNPYGGFLALMTLLSLGVWLGLTVAWWPWRPSVSSLVFPSGRRRLVLWVVAAIAAGANGLGLLFSWSRGAWLGFGAGALVLTFWAPRRRWHGLGLLLLSGLLLAAILVTGAAFNRLPAGLADRITSGFTQDLRFDDVRGVDITDENYAVLERLAHWQAALAMARDHAWLGVGFGNYEPAYADYRLINWPDALGHAHNYYLNLLAETGVWGLVTYVLFWLVVAGQNLRLLRHAGWPRRGAALGLLAAWAALATHHLVDKLYVNNVYIHLGVMLGVQHVFQGMHDDLNLR